jgi:hypothetical protein
MEIFYLRSIGIESTKKELNVEPTTTQAKKSSGLPRVEQLNHSEIRALRDPHSCWLVVYNAPTYPHGHRLNNAQHTSEKLLKMESIMLRTTILSQAPSTGVVVHRPHTPYSI